MEFKGLSIVFGVYYVFKKYGFLIFFFVGFIGFVFVEVVYRDLIYRFRFVI